MIQVTTLSNGFRIATDYIPTVETASIGVWVKCGARNETQANNGVAHFLEHMAFKGTSTRNAKEIAESIEQVGGYLNAYTSRESTAYYAHVLKQDVGLAFDILQDILNDSVFDVGELEKEREVILQEIGQCYDTPDDIIFDYFQETAFANQPMGRSILGPSENIKAFTRETVAGFMQQYYCPSKLVLAVAGNVDHDAICRMAEEKFGRKLPLVSGTLDVAQYTGGVLYENRTLEQAHIVLGFKGVSMKDASYYPMNIYSAILGDGMSSRLFQEIREKRGLVYSIYSFHSAYSDAGVFGVYAGCDPKKSMELINVVAGELRHFSDTLSEQEVQKAKNQFKARLAMSMESTSGRCQRLANQLLMFDRPIEQREVIEKIDAVSLEDIQRAATDVWRSEPILTAIGNELELPKQDVLHSMFK